VGSRAEFQLPDARLDSALSEINKFERRGALATFGISAVAILVCLFGNLGAIGLVGPDEPRYAWIARAMAETGDWVTPRLYGQPWFEKPILYYWAAAAGFLLHLPAEWAARLPSAFAALAAAIALGWLARKHYGDSDSLLDPPLLAPLLFSTCVAAIGFARAATPDMLFSASITLAMASAASIFRQEGVLRGFAGDSSSIRRNDTWALVLFGGFLGLGVLAKGPAAIALAGGAIVLWAIATGHWRAAFRIAHPISIAVFCVVALPWYILCGIRNPDFLRIFIFQHNLERYLTPMFQHKQPFWFFAPIVLLALLPWTVLLWPVAREGLRLWREKSWKDSPGFFFACWAIFPVVFFSISRSKLPGYVLPAIPPLALLCSVAMSRMQARGRAATAWTVCLIGATWIALGIAAGHASHRFAWENLGLDFTPTRAAIVGYFRWTGPLLVAAALIFAGIRGQLRLAMAICALSVAGAVEIANLEILPALDPFYSARHHEALMHNDLHPDRILTYHLRRTWSYGLAFYFHREIPEWSPADPEAALVLTTPEGLEEIRKLDRFRGALDESYVGILYVPVQRVPR
jgi:4-amino-4-deoxy-L-arabinose transferase-like glycosyltransferase